MRLIFMAAVLVAAVHAQDAPTLLLQGIVVDIDSHVPIAGARVTPLLAGNAPFSAVTTDLSGNFQLRVPPGARVTVTAQAPGYQYGQASLKAIPAGQTTGYVEVLLSKLQNLNGMVVDDDTRKPLAGLRIEILQREGPLLPGGPQAVTSRPDGSFSFINLPPGEYVVRITDKPAPVIREIPASTLSTSREKALQVPEGVLSYGTIVWPGRNADAPQVPGIKISGASVDVGEIRLRKSKLLNLSGLISPCEEGSKIEIALARPDENGRLLYSDIVCGSGFQLLNLPDGTFKVSATQGFPQRRFGSQTIDPRTPSPVQLTLNAFVSLQIQVEMEDGSPQKIQPQLRLGLNIESGLVGISAPSRTASGDFEAVVYPGERYRLSATMPPTYYMKQLFYNGVALPDATHFTAFSVPLGQLRLILSDRAGTVEVRAGEQAAVILVKEGMSSAEVNATRSVRSTGPDGKATFPALAPGKYRVALSSDTLPVTEQTLTEALRRSTAVTVEEGQTVSISLETR